MAVASGRGSGGGVQEQGARRRFLVAPLIVALMVLAGCSGDQAGDAETSASGAPTSGDAAAGGTEGGGDLVVAIGEGDPMDWQPKIDNEKASIHFGDTLTQVNPETGELEGALAESYELSDDGRTWTFRLRPDVQFHGGWGTVTAEDVKFTWGEWIAEDSDHGSRAIQMRQAVDGNLEENFEIVSDLEFRLHTTQPVVALDEVLSSSATGMTVTSKRYFDEEGDAANQHPIGTGPWQFVSSDPGVEMVLERADTLPHPWRETPAYDRLVLKVIPDGAARLSQVQAGALQVAELAPQLTGEAEAAGLQIVANKNIGHADMFLGGMYYGDAENLDTEAPWIQGDNPDSERGKAVREALSLAIDRQAILERIAFNQGELTAAPLYSYASADYSYDESWDMPAYDPDRARQRLADGGYPDGFPVEVLLFPQEVDTVGMGEAIAGMWEEIGIQVTRTPVEEDAVDELLVNKTTAGKAWINVNPYYQNPNPTLVNYMDVPGLDDYKWFHPAIDEGYPLLVDEPDFDRRWEVGRQILQELIADTVPLPLMGVNMVFVTSSDVSSYTPFPNVNTINSLETVR